MGQLGLLLQLLLEVAVGLCLFGSDRSGSEATVVACWVAFKQAGALLGIHCHHDHTCPEKKGDSYASFLFLSYLNQHAYRTKNPITSLTAAQWPHFSILRVNLGDVGQPAAQHICRDVITKLVFPFSCLDTSPVHLGATVSCARHRRALWFYINIKTFIQNKVDGIGIGVNRLNV